MLPEQKRCNNLASTRANPFPAGTNVMLTMGYGEKRILACGQVMDGRQDIGMGIAFTTVGPEDQKLLEDLCAD